MNTDQAIRELPKAELHIHLLGSIRPRTLLHILEEESIESPLRNDDEYDRLFQYRDFAHFISVYGQVIDNIPQEKYFEQIAYEMLEDCAKSNTRYVEFSFSAPDHVKRGLDYGNMLDHINRGVRKAKSDHGIESNIRIDLVRNYGLDSARETLSWIKEKSENVISIDIGGSEHTFPPEPYAEIYREAKEMGLHLVAHAGEAAGPESVWGAIEALKVERVGHAVSAAQDLRLLERIKRDRIGIEACPVSNVRTGAVQSLQEHPIREFYDMGLLVTVNSDDPTFFHTDLDNEYLQLHEHLGFTLSDLLRLSLNAVDASFLLDSTKERLRSSFKETGEKIIDSAR
ncbi:MAG: adenosine deaminase [Candidatus Thorarchaeota archaeon]|nr:MAG: adenosine deaminase [Candidatus Thorarchaeota archaeon]